MIPKRSVARAARLAAAFVTLAALAAPAVHAQTTEKAVFAGGCFWGIEAVFDHVKGVKQAVSGYSGGKVDNPSYEMVSAEVTGHAESVEVTFDPKVVSYQQLLEVFFESHDPTELNRQGPDTGTSYRTAIFYANPSQQHEAEAMIAKLTAEKKYPRKIVTEVTPLKKFWPAEAYHQHYLEHHPDQPYIVYNDLPKLAHLKQTFPALYTSQD